MTVKIGLIILLIDDVVLIEVALHHSSDNVVKRVDVLPNLLEYLQKLG